MIDPKIQEAANYVRHAAAKPIQKDKSVSPLTPLQQRQKELAGVYVQRFIYTINALATNATSIARCVIKCEDADVDFTETFIPTDEQACENKQNYELFLRIFTGECQILSESVMSKEALLRSLAFSAYKVISFDNGINIKVPCEDLVNFCCLLPDFEKIELKVMIIRDFRQGQRRVLHLFHRLTDTSFVEQMTLPTQAW